MSNTALIGMPRMTSSQSSKEVTFNDALSVIDALLARKVLDRTLTAPPGSPADGALYIVAASPTGAWAGKAGYLAYYNVTSWLFIAPVAGWDHFYVSNEATYYRYNGSSWTADTSVDNSAVPVNTQTGTSYTLVLGDKGYVVEMNNASANTVTIPPNSSVAFPVGTQILIRQYGAGQTTVAAGAGVTLRHASSLTCRTQYSQLTLHKRATDEWILGGDMT